MNYLKLLLILTLASVYSSCSNSPVVQDYSITASATTEYDKLESDMKNASANQVNVLAPENFENAEELMKKAKSSLDNQKEAKDTLHIIAKSRAYLNRANQFSQVSKTNLEEVILARQQAIAANAPRITASEFAKTDKELKAVTSDIENNNLKSSAKQKGTLQLSYLNLELRSIKRTNLDKPKSIINQAVNDGAKEFAPRSLALAEKSVQDFDAFITANRHDTNAIAKRYTETMTSSNHLLKITHSSKKGDKTSSEDMALMMKDEQVKTASKQSEINKQNTELANNQNQLTKGQNTNLALIAKNNDLETEQELNQRFEDARSEFSENEAEVYKQGNTLMIRLKGLEFPSAQAGLKAENFDLLAKVQKVIKSFDGGVVVVEGHTDSTGGKQVNDKLSSKRAKAVRDYFVANANGDKINIKSLGYGYQKPLASNKTAEGRAKNRRVDVLITAENN